MNENCSENNKNITLIDIPEVLESLCLSGYLGIINLMEKPTKSNQINSKFIFDSLTQKYGKLASFCTCYHINNYKLFMILNNKQDFEYSLLISIAEAIKCDVKDLFV